METMVGKAIGEIQSIRPFLKWAGSKRLILSTLAGYWSDDFERYIEPFAGSSSLFFYLQPKRAILGDINSDLIETYKQIKHNVDDVSSDLARMTKGKDEYYRIRSIDIKTLSPSQRAARFIYLNKLSFNGLYRTNQKGVFNVPFGGEKAGPVPTKESLQRCSKALQRVQLFSGDFGLVLERAQPGDFVYLDPPYSVKSRRIFNEYDKSSFSTAELKRLRQWLDKLTKLGVVFLLSYAKSSEAKLLMDGYPTKEINVRRNIAGFSQYRRNAKEWLASNRDLLNERKNVSEKNR
jgi:DNA adenine methylase